jgi:Tol biopolymer transport system component
MKQLSLWFALFSCAVLASLLPESCIKENGILDQKSLSKTSTLANGKPSITPPANPAIAYWSKSGLTVMNADGSNQTTIVSGGNPGVWSPDGKSLLFERTVNSQTGIWLVDVSVVNGKPTGSNLRQIPINLPGRPNGERWSPLGDSIVFLTEEPKIYTVSSAGGTPRLAYAPAAGFDVFDPDWSPDGTRIVFDESNAAWTLTSLKVLTIATGNITIVIPPSPPSIYYPTWSHHGDRIVYETGAIYTVTPTANATPVKVTDGGYPTWSPDDSKLALVSGKSSGIFTYTFSGGAMQSLLGTGTFLDWKRF